MSTSRPRWNLNHLLMAAVVLGLCWVGPKGDPEARLQFRLINTVLAAPVAALTFGLATLVHGLVARLFRDRLVYARIGSGWTLRRLVLGGCNVDLNAVPASDMRTHVTTRARGQRLRVAVCYGASALALAAVFVAVYGSNHTWAAREHHFGTRLAPDPVLFYTAGWSALLSLLVAIGALGVPGFSTITPAMLQTWRSLGLAFEAGMLHERGAFDQAEAIARNALAEFPDDRLLQLTLAAALSGRGDPAAFATVESLRSSELPPALRTLFLNLWAWECYVRNASEHRAEADVASRDALAGDPKNPSLLDTRGHVLLWNGNAVDAIPILERAYRLSTKPGTRSSAAAGLAMANVALNRAGDAAAWLAKARSEGIHDERVAKAAALVEPLARA